MFCVSLVYPEIGILSLFCLSLMSFKTFMQQLFAKTKIIMQFLPLHNIKK